jgi:lipoprotein-anchoring transpeptidase ErfK/SrfK
MTFETHSLDKLTAAYAPPNDGEVVGVGQPVAIPFDEKIPNRLAAQRETTGRSRGVGLAVSADA